MKHFTSVVNGAAVEAGDDGLRDTVVVVVANEDRSADVAYTCVNFNAECDAE